MTIKETERQDSFLTDTKEEGVIKLLNSRFGELMSLGPSATDHVCKLFRHYLMSTFGLEYFTKLNTLAEKKLIANTNENRDYIYKWMDNDVMEAIDAVCETDIFDNPKSISALADVVVALYTALNTVKEELIEHDVDYILDMPYQLTEMIKYSPSIPWFYKSSFKREERGQSEKVDISMSDGKVSFSYRMDIGRWTTEK